MSISNIQKEKFLDVIYKKFYSDGKIPKESEILSFFSRYFSNYTLGQPLSLNPEIFRQISIGDVDIFNETMLKALFNIEVLYDSVLENSEDIMTVTTALNKRLESLRARRIRIENKIDNLLFANENTEGVFSAYTDSFSSIDGSDLSFTSAYVDVENGQVIIPQLNSMIFDTVATKSVAASGVTYSSSFDGRQISSNTPVSDEESLFSSVFDGLDNTEWKKEYSFETTGFVTLSINLPISKSVLLSAISGKLSTISPVDIYCRINYTDGTNVKNIFSKKFNRDYDKFSFNFESKEVSSIDIFMTKTQPDQIQEGRKEKYLYRFGIRDISISGIYRDRFATYVSAPIGVKSKNDKNLAIDAVSLSVSQSGLENGSISYYIAPDNPNAELLSDFSWTPIGPKGESESRQQSVQSYSNTVFLQGSFFKSKKILETVTDPANQIQKIPVLNSKNLNVQNPIENYATGSFVYRIAKIDTIDDPYGSYILSGIGLAKGYYVSYINDIHNELESLKTWNSIIGGSTDRQVYLFPSWPIGDNQTSYVGPTLDGISVLLETKLLCASEKTVRHTFVKNDEISLDWRVAIYINGKRNLISEFEKSKIIEWNFKEGVNNIQIAIDIPKSANGSISLMQDTNLSNYGMIYLNNYGYVDFLEFKKNKSIFDYVFTIDNVYGNKEILSRQDISSNSRLFYYTNNPDRIEQVRLRADLTRSRNPIGSPSLDSFTLKFKNSQNFQDIKDEIQFYKG